MSLAKVTIEKLFCQFKRVLRKSKSNRTRREKAFAFSPIELLSLRAIEVVELSIVLNKSCCRWMQ
jgi:hypothetical protein